MLPPQERYLSRNEVTVGRTRRQKRQAQLPSAQTGDDAHSEAIGAITEVQNVGEAEIEDKIHHGDLAQDLVGSSRGRQSRVGEHSISSEV